MVLSRTVTSEWLSQNPFYWGFHFAACLEQRGGVLLILSLRTDFACWQVRALFNRGVNHFRLTPTTNEASLDICDGPARVTCPLLSVHTVEVSGCGKHVSVRQVHVTRGVVATTVPDVHWAISP